MVQRSDLTRIHVVSLSDVSLSRVRLGCRRATSGWWRAPGAASAGQTSTWSSVWTPTTSASCSARSTACRCTASTCRPPPTRASRATSAGRARPPSTIWRWATPPSETSAPTPAWWRSRASSTPAGARRRRGAVRRRAVRRRVGGRRGAGRGRGRRASPAPRPALAAPRSRRTRASRPLKVTRSMRLEDFVRFLATPMSDYKNHNSAYREICKTALTGIRALHRLICFKDSIASLALDILAAYCYHLTWYGNGY